jgi:hypothetical protein
VASSSVLIELFQIVTVVKHCAFYCWRMSAALGHSLPLQSMACRKVQPQRARAPLLSLLRLSEVFDIFCRNLEI